MNAKSVFEKYSLPEKVRVLIKHSPQGYFVKFPDYEGCITFTENPLELNYKITDALLTYFEVPRHVAENLPVLYVPEEKLSSEENKSFETDFSFFAALNSLNANNSSFR